MHIDGRIDGIIDSTFDLSVGESGYVTGLVKARRVVLSGVFEGKIACESIDVLSTGKLIGELICEEFTIETGGKFIGQSHEMTEGGMVVSLPETFSQMKTKMNLAKTEPKPAKELHAKVEPAVAPEQNKPEEKK